MPDQSYFLESQRKHNDEDLPLRYALVLRVIQLISILLLEGIYCFGFFGLAERLYEDGKSRYNLVSAGMMFPLSILMAALALANFLLLFPSLRSRLSTNKVLLLDFAGFLICVPVAVAAGLGIPELCRKGWTRCSFGQFAIAWVIILSFEFLASCLLGYLIKMAYKPYRYEAGQPTGVLHDLPTPPASPQSVAVASNVGLPEMRQETGDPAFVGTSGRDFGKKADLQLL